jgi:L-ascorbate metabolism protein UlaG (beta-lactamase superfamily)
MPYFKRKILENNVEIVWLGHSAFRIRILNKNIMIYIDPYNIGSNNPLANYIFITHPHFDHFSPQDIKKIYDERTKFILPKELYHHYQQSIALSPPSSYDFVHFGCDAVEAYNRNKSYHPKEKNWMGYILKINGLSIYHAGDTDLIPEMSIARGCDYALLPIGGNYTMNVEEACDACNLLKPRYAVPMHYGTIIGDESMADDFAENAPCDVIVLYPQR